MPTDLRDSIRSLRRTPRVAATIVATLALGLGLNIAFFTVVNATLLTPLEFRAADRLVSLGARWERDGIDVAGHTGAQFQEIRDASRTLEDVAAVMPIRQNLAGEEYAEQVQVGWVSHNFFSLLGVDAAYGRILGADDPAGTAMLSHEAGTRIFGNPSAAVSRVVRLDGYAYQIVGVLPAGFRASIPGLPDRIDIWKVPDPWWQNGNPWTADAASAALLRVVGRRAPDATVADVQGELDGFAANARKRLAAFATARLAYSANDLHERLVRAPRRGLLLLQAAVVVLLLIACANVVNLLLVRLETRRQELAVRMAIGAHRWQIARLLIVESGLVVGAGAIAALGVCVLVINVMTVAHPPQIARLTDARMDLRVIGFAAVVSAACSLLVAVVPVVSAMRRSWANELTGARLSAGRSRLSSALVVAQVSLSMVLLIAAGLLTVSLTRLGRVDPGFRPDHLLTFSVSAPGARYSWPDGVDRFLRTLEDRIRQLPGVENAGVVWPLPLSGSSWGGRYSGGGVEQDRQAIAQYRLVTPAYFDTIGIPLIDGRNFGTGDPKRTVLVSRSVADRAWPGQSAVGGRIQATPWGGAAQDFEVIGVVENVRVRDIRAAAPDVLYFDSKGWAWTEWEIDVVVRAAGDPSALVAPVRTVLRDLDRDIPMAETQPMRFYVDSQLAINRFALATVGLLAVVAGLLAAIGLYSLVSYTVVGSLRELAIRMALGGTRAGILTLIMRRGLSLVLAGLGIGTVAAIWAGRFLTSYLFDVQPQDPWTIAATAAGFFVVGAAGVFLPARRASRINPLEALRMP
jgi:predicted permease